PGPRSHLGNDETPLVFSADEVQYDDDLGLVVARGNVEISQKDQILLADTVSYNQRTNTLTASGHVSLLQPTGDILFADYVELDDNMRDGFLKNARLLLSDRSRVAGNTARRIAGNRTEIRHGVYSPCELCREDPSRPPVWQIKADEIIHDKELQLIEYRDAVMEIDGIPVAYAPYFSHPDPSVKRRSGFLAPSPGFDSTNGYQIAIPYYWVISQDKDATIRPIFTTEGGEVLGGEYRQRFGNGYFTANGSINYGGNGPGGNALVPAAPINNEVRGHLFTDSEFDLTQDVRTGLDIRRASDFTYLQRYHFLADTTFLTSRAYAEDFGSQSYGAVNAFAFQSLHAGLGDSGEPIVAPIASYVATSDPDALGGRWSLDSNALNLLRLTGTDERRLSLGPQWRLPFDGLIGDRFTFTASLRSDAYYSNDVVVDTAGTEAHSALAARVFPQGALQWNYPWIRPGSTLNTSIEPIAALIAGPNGGNPAKIPNEDSQGFEYDETSLFRPDRFPGYDRVDSGQRVDYGLRVGLYGPTSGNAHLLIGQSYAFQPNPAFPAGSGVNAGFSDVVGRLVLSPDQYFSLYYRFRLDSDTYTPQRQEAGLAVGPGDLRLNLSYIDINAVPGIAGFQASRQINGSLTTNLTRYWSASFTNTQDFSSGLGGTLATGVSATYRDDCIAFSTSVTNSRLTVGDVKPGLAVVFTLVFRNLGEIGVQGLNTSGF
ncbi:MAG TPA: LPS assembly protein LptD, partial [Stellaceae bacterium]|nr:LPS assembly protein LptD [Stellaceae bacterium]